MGCVFFVSLSLCLQHTPPFRPVTAHHVVVLLFHIYDVHMLLLLLLLCCIRSPPSPSQSSAIMAASAFHVYIYARIIYYYVCESVCVCARVLLCVREIRCGGSAVCVCEPNRDEAVVCGGGGDGDDYKMPTDWSQERSPTLYNIYIYSVFVCACTTATYIGETLVCVFVDVRSSHMRVPDRQKLTSVSCVQKRAKVLGYIIRTYIYIKRFPTVQIHNISF